MSLHPDPLSSLFDGWMTEIEPGTDFEAEERWAILDWQEDEDEELGPYESPSPIPVYSSAQGYYPAGEIPFQREQSAWAGFVLAAKSLADLIGGSTDAYQTGSYTNGKMDQPVYKFKFMQGETGWQCAKGARL